MKNMSDEELGKFVRKYLKVANSVAEEKNQTTTLICGLDMVLSAANKNSESLFLEFKDVEYEDKNLGDWIITVKKIHQKECIYCGDIVAVSNDIPDSSIFCNYLCHQAYKWTE